MIWESLVRKPSTLWEDHVVLAENMEWDMIFVENVMSIRRTIIDSLVQNVTLELT